MTIIDQPPYVYPRIITSHIGGAHILARATSRTSSISGLITRADEEILASKVNEVNAMLKQSCLEKNWPFIEHCNITSQHFNKSKLHLNKQGTSLLA